MKLLFKLLMRIGLISSGPAVTGITSATQIEGTSLVHTVTLASAVAVIDGLYPFSLSGVTATSGTDYTATPTFSAGVTRSGGTLTVPVGVSSFTITVSTTNDAVFEGTETYSITIGGMTNTGTITDDESAPTIASVSSASATEGSNIVHTVAVTGTAQASRTFAFAFSGAAVGGTDYNATPTFSAGVTLSGGNITVPAGVTSFAVTVATINNGSIDGSRSYTLTIGGASGTGTVNDDDAVTPAFTVTMTALSNALGTVTTLAYINGGGGGGTITIGVTNTTLTGTAPFNVVFDASTTTATGVSKPFQNLFYVWDFGDDQSTYWANGAYVNQNKNAEYGPIASHVFQNSGSKTVTLYVYDGSGNSASQTFTVTVNAADTTFSGTNTICIANGTAVTPGTGDAPSGCISVGSSSNFDTALSTYRGAYKRIMFQRGGTFSVPDSTWTDINVSGMHICAFGSGADPIINVGANTFGLRVGASAGASVLSVYDLEFRGGNNTNNLGIGGAANIDNLLFLRCKVDNFSNGIMSFGKSEIEAGSLKKMWENLAVVDCTLDHIYGGVSGSGHNTAFMSANKFTWMGNYVDNRGGGSHVLRTPYITQACVKHNYFAGQGSEGGYECWKMHGPNWADAGGAISPGSYTEYINAGNNVFVGGVGGGWIVSLGPQATPTDERLRHILLDGNYIKRGDLAGSVCINIRGNVSNVAVRNNVFNMSVAATGFAMDISGYTSDSASGVGANTLDVINNTAYSSTSGMTTTGLFNFGGSPVDCRFINNLVYTPAMGSMGVVAASGGSGWVASNNSSNAQAIGTNPSFSTIPAFATNHLLATDFKPSTSRTHGAGIADVAIRDDLFHITRTGTMDLGAVQA